MLFSDFYRIAAPQISENVVWGVQQQANRGCILHKALICARLRTIAALRGPSVGLTEQAAEPADLRSLPDKELVGRFCPERTDEAVAEELWRRHNPEIYKTLAKCTRTLCPAFYDQGDLAHDSYLQARQNLLNRICGCENTGSERSFSAWLGRVARSTMLDERRKVTESRIKRKIVKVSIEKPSQDEDEVAKPAEITEETFLEIPPLAIRPKPEAVRFHGPFEPRSHHEYFRSLYSTSPLDPSAPVERKIVESQRKVVFLKILTRHVQESDENAACGAMIRLRYWSKWRVAKIVERFYGEPLTKQQEQARRQAYFRLLDKNYDGIIKDLERAGIMRPEHI